MRFVFWGAKAGERTTRGRPDAAVDDRIRAQQLNTVNRLIPAMMVANIVCVIGLAILLYPAHGIWLVGWFGFVVLLSLARLVQAVQANRGPPRVSVSRRAASRSLVQAIVSAVCFTLGPVWLLSTASGLTLTVIVCQLTGTMWAGALVLATMPAAAIAYVVVTCALICLGFLMVSWDIEHLFLALLFLAGAATAIRSVLQVAALFAADEHQQIDLKRQSDLIGLLLKDYEEQTSDWLWETDAALCLKCPSPRFLQVLGRPFEEVVGADLLALLAHPAIDGNTDARAVLADTAAARLSFRDHLIPFATVEGPCWWSFSGRPVFDRDNGFAGYRGVATDVTATKLAQARLAYMAHYDAVTDLPNRSFFCSTLERFLRTAHGRSFAILSLDLDGFKAVNDRFGHPAGDAFLVEVANRLRAIMRNGDTIARFGSDEFLVLIEDVAYGGGVEALCRRAIHGLSLPVDIMGEAVTAGASIGVAYAPTDGTEVNDLLKNADAALCRAKAAGRGTFRFFEPEMDQRVQERQQLVQDLRAALLRDELVLHYQPFISTSTGQVTGYEALVRWNHPVRGLVMPSEFVPLAEESGLIEPIGVWVIETACHEAARWPMDLRVSVNISAVQFRNQNLPMTTLAALTRSQLAPTRLEIEVTETLLVEDVEAALGILQRFRALGIRIALDDFGTGYSSLSYLRRFPFDRIKIDRSFVERFESQHDSQVIVRAIIDIARGLGMAITAEGVETQGQVDALGRVGCEELQGYRFSRPMPATAIDHGLHAIGLTDDLAGALLATAQEKVA